jgi:fucose permease
MTIGIIVAAGVTSQLVGRIGVRGPMIVGPAMTVVGMVWITRITPSSTYLDILGPLIVIALGMGLVFVPLTLTAVSGVEGDEAGLASALLNTMQQVGGALGLAVLTTISIAAANSRKHALHSASKAASNAATTHGYTTAFWVSAGIACLALIVSVTFIRVPQGGGSELTRTRAAL